MDSLYNWTRLPNGGIPKGLKGNKVQQENDYLNQDTYLA